MSIYQKVLGISFSVFSSYNALFAEIIVTAPNSKYLPGSESADIKTIAESSSLISFAISWLINITAILSIIAITWAAIQMMTGAGDEEKAKKARYTMIYAFVGLIVAGIAYSVVELVTKLNLNTLL